MSINLTIWIKQLNKFLEKIKQNKTNRIRMENMKNLKFFKLNRTKN